MLHIRRGVELQHALETDLGVEHRRKLASMVRTAAENKLINHKDETDYLSIVHAANVAKHASWCCKRKTHRHTHNDCRAAIDVRPHQADAAAGGPTGPVLPRPFVASLDDDDIHEYEDAYFGIQNEGENGKRDSASDSGDSFGTAAEDNVDDGLELDVIATCNSIGSSGGSITVVEDGMLSVAESPASFQGEADGISGGSSGSSSSQDGKFSVTDLPVAIKDRNASEGEEQERLEETDTNVELVSSDDDSSIAESMEAAGNLIPDIVRDFYVTPASAHVKVRERWSMALGKLKVPQDLQNDFMGQALETSLSAAGMQWCGIDIRLNSRAELDCLD